MNPQNGKGSKPRKERDDKAYASNWDRIFRQKSDNSLKDQSKKSSK